MQPAFIGTLFKPVFIPQYLIVFLNNTSIPSGWTRYSAMDSKYIVGAGSTYAWGDTGGSVALDVSGRTSGSAGSHTPSSAFDTNPDGGGKSAIASASTSQVPKKTPAVRSAMLWWTVMRIAASARKPEVTGPVCPLEPS